MDSSKKLRINNICKMMIEEAWADRASQTDQRDLEETSEFSALVSSAREGWVGNGRGSFSPYNSLDHDRKHC